LQQRHPQGLVTLIFFWHLTELIFYISNGICFTAWVDQFRTKVSHRLDPNPTFKIFGKIKQSFGQSAQFSM
jgi:hypothetical protein